MKRKTNAELQELIEEMELKIRLRERLIDEQRSHIEVLKAKLNERKWWRIWK